MNFDEILVTLKNLGTEQNVLAYQEHGASANVFGVSYVNLGKLRKEIDPTLNLTELAIQLWNTQNLDAQMLATMIAEPDNISEASLDTWVKEIYYFPLADSYTELVYASPYSMKKMLDWTFSDKEYIKRIGYNLLSNFAKFNTVFNNGFFEAYINIIENEINFSANRAKEGMNNCLIAIGSRNEALKKKVVASSKKIGSVLIEHGSGNTETYVIEDQLEKIFSRRNLVK